MIGCTRNLLLLSPYKLKYYTPLKIKDYYCNAFAFRIHEIYLLAISILLWQYTKQIDYSFIQLLLKSSIIGFKPIKYFLPININTRNYRILFTRHLSPPINIHEPLISSLTRVSLQDIREHRREYRNDWLHSATQDRQEGGGPAISCLQRYPEGKRHP